MSFSSTRGFTLLELMITVLVIAILTAIAWPNFRDFMHRNAVTAQANQILASLQYARNEAVSRRYPTGLCGTSTDNACPSAGDTNFEDGWLVWRDVTLSGTPSYDSSKDELLRVTQAQNGVSIRSFGGTSAGVIAFDQRGAVIGAGGGTTNIVVCAKKSSSDPLGANTPTAPGKYVRVDASGRVTVQNLAATDGCGAAPAS